MLVKECSDDCPRIYDPVCGNNHKTYDSECLMKFAICESGLDIKVDHYGPCKRGTSQPKPTGNNIIKLTYKHYLNNAAKLFLMLLQCIVSL